MKTILDDLDVDYEIGIDEAAFYLSLIHIYPVACNSFSKIMYILTPSEL